MPTRSTRKPQANARYALELAIAELQAAAGPDQRITATAAILDTDPDTPEPDGIAHPHWTGVWHSWDSWLNGESTNPRTGGTESIDDTYTSGRESRFQQWLVSGPGPAELAALDTAKSSTAIPTEDRIELVGAGTLGSAATAENIVTAGLVDLPPASLPGNPAGRVAWWIGDEGVKANLATARPHEAADDPATAGFQLADARRVAPEALPDWDGLADALDDDPDLADRFLTLESPLLVLPESDRTAARESLQAGFHSLTRSSRGLLTDTRSGGWKRDLSLLLERDHLPAPYAGISPADTTPLRPYEDLPDALYPANFQSWYSLQQYYQLYRIDPAWSPPLAPKAGNYLAYSADPAHADVDGGLFWQDGRPTIDYYLRGGVNELGSYRHWVVPKLEMVIYMQREPVPNTNTSKYLLIFNPVATLWNPYNVAFRMPPIHFNYGRTPLRMKIFRDGADSGWQQLPRYGINVWFRNTYQPVGSADTSWIEFEPGETRAFSPAPLRAEVQNHVEVYPGYNAGEGGWTGYLFGGAAIPNHEKVEIAIKMLSVANIDGGSMFPNTRPHPGEYGPRANPWQLNYIPFPEDKVVIPEEPGERVEFPGTGDDRRRPLAIIRTALKSGQRTDFGDPDYPDYRNRFLVHANPTTHRPMLNSPTDRYLAAAQYEVAGMRVRGELDRNLPQIAPDNRASYVGSGLDANEGQTAWTYIGIPTLPLTSLGQLQHLRLEPGARRWDSRTIRTIPSSHLWDVSANQGYGFANSLAHPLIPGDAIYQEDGANRRNRSGVLQYDRIADTWDHSFLTNDALFDGWFFSGIAPQESGAFDPASHRSQREVFDDFVAGTTNLPNSRLTPIREELADPDRFFSGDDPTDSAFEELASALSIHGAFNVNSTESVAWSLLLHGLKARSLVEFKPGDSGRDVTAFTQPVLSRFSLTNDPREGDGPYDPATWTGVRFLTDAQIDRLAEEIVKQVKLRGPFLNMADFVNRRLATGETGLRGALQAAIDWDELDGATPDPAAADSINGRFKDGTDLIQDADIATLGYSNPGAAKGSRWAGAPGYVLQSDLLTPLAPVVSVRSDTFKIRAYGEVRGPDGQVRARAWCEAVVQRFPEFVHKDTNDDSNPDDGNLATEPPNLSAGTENPDLSPLNHRHGRRFKIVRFRWLNPEEV